MKPRPPVNNTFEGTGDSYSHTIYYNSTRKRNLRTILNPKEFVFYWHLLKILVRKDLITRYQRSVLGIWWALVNPLFTALVLFLVFNQQYSSKLQSGIPFGPYVLSGTLALAFLAQGCVSATQNLQSSAQIFIRLPSPPEIFSISTATVGAINLCFGLIPLLLWHLLAGGDIGLQLILFPIFLIISILFVSGIALIGFYFVTRFGDAINLMMLVATLMTFLTPVFYPIDSISARAQLVLNLNPLTHYINVFRFLTLDIGDFNLIDWTWVFSSAGIVFLAGITIFNKSWRRTASLL
jgi:ABC-type polysaccharide/polyol phosphate export permease